MSATTTTESTTIRLREELVDELYARKNRGDTYSDVVERLLEDEEQ